ncbi:pectinesterase [Sarracenia purpurea var. burkii]
MATSTHQPLLDLPLRKSSLCNCKFLCLILISLAAIVGSVTFLTTRKINAPLSTKVCDRALDLPSCFALVSELSPAGRLNGLNLLQEFLKKSASGIRDAVETTTDIIRRINDPKEQAAVADCLELMDLSLDRVLDSVTGSYSDVHSWLSSVLTNHVTCWDGLKNGSVRSAMEPLMKDLIARARVSLAMVVEISPEEDELLLRRVNGGFPWWVTRRDREILEDGPENIKANVVVAKDGSGNFKTVKEAAASAPEKSKNRYVIYVKKGTYKENVEIGKRKKNVMLVGDGMNSTIITGSLNVVDGSTTFHSATVGKVLTFTTLIFI